MRTQLNVYLTDEEQRLVKRAAAELGTTQAYIVRLALRNALDLPIGRSGESELARLALSSHQRDMSKT